MTNRDRVMELAEKILQLEAEIQILNAELGRPNNRQIEKKVQSLLNQHLTSKRHQQRVSELESAFRGDIPDGALIRTLHEEILRRATIQ